MTKHHDFIVPPSHQKAVLQLNHSDPLLSQIILSKLTLILLLQLLCVVRDVMDMKLQIGHHVIFAIISVQQVLEFKHNKSHWISEYIHVFCPSGQPSAVQNQSN